MWNTQHTVGTHGFIFLFFNVIFVPAPNCILEHSFYFCFFDCCCCCLISDFIQGQNCTVWHKREISPFILSKHKHCSDTEHGSFSPTPGLLHRHRRADSRISGWLSLDKHWREVWQPAPGKTHIRAAAPTAQCVLWWVKRMGQSS